MPAQRGGRMENQVISYTCTLISIAFFFFKLFAKVQRDEREGFIHGNCSVKHILRNASIISKFNPVLL